MSDIQNIDAPTEAAATVETEAPKSEQSQSQSGAAPTETVGSVATNAEIAQNADSATNTANVDEPVPGDQVISPQLPHGVVMEFDNDGPQPTADDVAEYEALRAAGAVLEQHGIKMSLGREAAQDGEENGYIKWKLTGRNCIKIEIALEQDRDIVDKALHLAELLTDTHLPRKNSQTDRSIDVDTVKSDSEIIYGQLKDFSKQVIETRYGFQVSAVELFNQSRLVKLELRPNLITAIDMTNDKLVFNTPYGQSQPEAEPAAANG